MEGKVVYFDKPGLENTEEVLKIAKERAKELGIKTILVASTRGETAVRAAEVFKGFKVIAVSHSDGFREPNTQEFTGENKKKFEDKGGILLTTTHAFAGISRAMRQQLSTASIGDTIASVLRIFGQGMKVVAEITIMAADAGLVRTDEEVICVTGTGRGADTAVVILPANSHKFFDLRIQEILCKPRFTVTAKSPQPVTQEHAHH